MRRIEMVSALNEIQFLFERTQVVVLLKQAITISGEGEAKLGTADILKIYAQLSKFPLSNTAREVIDILALSDMFKVMFWNSFVDPKARRSSIRNRRLYDRLNFASVILPKLIQLFEQESIREFKEQHEKPDSPFANQDLLTLILIEEPGQTSRPVRVIEAIESITLLYEAITKLREESSVDLALIACDSGSDKSFDFTGLATAVKEVKALILEVWNRVVYFREKKVHVRLKLVAEALPIIHQIGTLKDEDKLSREEAEVLKQKILGGVTKFLNSGAIIPEIEENTTYNPRQLMAPEPKLLTTGPEHDEEEPGPNGDSDLPPGIDAEAWNDLSDEDKETYLKVVAKLTSTEIPQESIEATEEEDYLDIEVSEEASETTNEDDEGNAQPDAS